MFDKLIFSPEHHAYTYDGIELVPTTTFLKSVIPEFDQDLVSKKVASKENKTQKEVLDSWALKGEIGRNKGTQIHKYIEDQLNGIKDPILSSINQKLPEMVAFDNFLLSEMLSLVLLEC